MWDARGGRRFRDTVLGLAISRVFTRLRDRGARHQNWGWSVGAGNK